MLLHLCLRIAINSFILVMLFWMIFWDAEPRNPIRRHWIPVIQPLLVWLGLHGNWNMFSPDPPSRTMWPRVRMFMSNGDVVDWEPAPIGQMSVLEKIRFKKFHKFYHEVARPSAAYHTKRDFVEFLLRRRFHRGQCVRVEVYVVIKPGRPFHEQSVDGPGIFQKLVYTFHPVEEGQA